MTFVRPDAGRADDPLLDVAPAIWMGVLVGADLPDEGGTIVCPFGDCATPSFRVYESGREGVRCFGDCQRVFTTPYAFAAEWWSLPPGDLDLIRERLSMALVNAPLGRS